MRDHKSALLVGPLFGLALFVAERCIVARVHLRAIPGGDELGRWLLGTAALYGVCGALLGAAALALPAVRQRPWIVAHLATATTIALAFLLVPSWYATLVTAAAAGAITHLAWAPVRLWRGAPLVATGLLAGAAIALSLVRPAPLPSAPPLETTAPAPPSDAPDILLLVLDTVRRDRVSAYGAPRATTPAFDALAGRGALLESARVSSPWSLPTHATLFTGRSPGSHGAHYEHPRLDPSVPTLAAILGAHGYRTAGVSANPWLSPHNGSARGFEQWFDAAPVRDLARCFVLRWATGGSRLRTKGGEVVAARARDLLAADRSADPRPLFLFVNVFEAHAPYDAVPADCGSAFLPEGADRADVARLATDLELAQTAGTSFLPQDEEVALSLALYDGAVHCADRVLGQILDAAAGSGRPTVTVALSDHGESLGEHGLVGHHHGLHDLLIRVPAAVAYPGEIPAGSRVEAPVRGVDVLPTLLDYAGVAPAGWPAVEGRSVRGLLAGGEDPLADGRAAFAEHFRPVFVLEAFRLARPAGRYEQVDRRRRAVFHRGYRFEEDSRGDRRLFDLTRDPLERDDLLARGEIPAAMPALLDRLASQPAWDAPPLADGALPATGLDDRTLEYLRELGYVP